MQVLCTLCSSTCRVNHYSHTQTVSTCPMCQHKVERRIRLFGAITSVNDLFTTKFKGHELMASVAGSGSADARQLLAADARGSDVNAVPLAVQGEEHVSRGHAAR